MKKILSVLLVLLMVFAFAACGGGDTAGGDDLQPLDGDGGVIAASGELEDLQLEWYAIKTNTGIPTFVAELVNPNPVAVDVTFDVNYFKGGENVKLRDGLFVNCLDAGERVMVWDTWEIPADADDVSLDFTYLEPSSYEVVPARATDVQERANGLDLKLKTDGDFADMELEIAYFNDGVLTSIDAYSFFPGDELTYSSEVLEPFNSYKIYVNAYK